MILATKIQSEKGKEIIKTANEFIFMELTVKKQKVGEIELYYFDDSVKSYCENCGVYQNDFPTIKCEKCDCETIEKTDSETQGEWLIKYRPTQEGMEEEDKPDWDIIDQGNI